RVARLTGDVRHHLPVDAAAFLGAVAIPLRRICTRRRADAAGGRWCARDEEADPVLFGGAAAGDAGAVLARRGRFDLCGCDRGARCPVDCRRAGGVARQWRHGGEAAVRLLDRLPVRAVLRHHHRQDGAEMSRDAKARANARLASIFGGIVVGMVGLSYASVPLYRMFCQVTGYGGTTQRAEHAPEVAGQRVVTVTFNADVAGTNLPWNFTPMQRDVQVH